MISEKTRHHIYEKYEGICVYCHRPVKYEDATIDHRFPKSKGGGDFKYNYFLACYTCNQHKDDVVYEGIAKDYVKNRTQQLLDKYPYLNKLNKSKNGRSKK
jgi:5-methylcytosine-specific restriction endonuclease McrA